MKFRKILIGKKSTSYKVEVRKLKSRKICEDGYSIDMYELEKIIEESQNTIISNIENGEFYTTKSLPNSKSVSIDDILNSNLNLPTYP